MKKIILAFFAGTLSFAGQSQFHTLKIPQPSNHVIETQQLGVTDITIDYSSPSANGRDVWNDPNVIPQNGNPIPWRAGANMNTTIEFSTDVTINGNPLKAGKYGFHIIPNGEQYTLLFAHANNLWGSYYVNVDKDVTLKAEVKSEECAYSEKLDFEFLNWKDSSVDIGLEWTNRRIPFTVSVDLNKTVVESFRNELRGINTYHWQAWDDAAKWCLAHNTNLEEAYTWANRSINGGYYGFAANKNVTNLTTKARLEFALKRKEDKIATINEILKMDILFDEAYGLGNALIRMDEPAAGLEVTNAALKKDANVWFLKLNKALCHYFMNDKKSAIKELDAVNEIAPNGFKPRLVQIKEEMKKGIYKLPS